MHDNEHKKLIARMKSFIKKLKANDSRAKKLANEFLINAGIITEKGNLRYPYRGLDGYKVSKRKNAKLKENRI